MHSAKEPLDPNWDNDYKALLLATGNIGWLLSGSFESSCDLDMYKFPFDTQECNLDFGNLLHMAEMVNLRTVNQTIDMSSYIESREFE